MGSTMFDEKLALILDTMPDGVYVTTQDREIVYWSAGAERITGFSAEEAVGSHCYDNILNHTDLDGTRLCFGGCPLEECIRTGEPRTVNEVFLKRKNGERLAVYMKTATFVEDGRTYGVEVFGELEAVAGRELTARVQELSDASITDPLSGLFNRRYFDATLEQQFEMFKRIGRLYGVVQIDIDDFKSINDTLGHATGDDAILFVADVLSRNARKMDVVARYGGDEFAIMCAVGSLEELEAYGRRLLMTARQSRFAPAADAGLALTISVGAALVDGADSEFRSAIARADAAMYEVKHSGRDGLVVSNATGT